MADSMSRKGDRDNDPRNSQDVPKDVQVVETILREIGITEYEPRVVNQLLEFTYST